MTCYDFVHVHSQNLTTYQMMSSRPVEGGFGNSRKGKVFHYVEEWNATMTSTILRLPRARDVFLQTMRIERYAKFDQEINTIILISKFDV